MMTGKHSYSFFSEQVAIIILTRDFNDKVHLNFIRKKEDDTWEKFEEGLHIQLKLNEVSKILDFLENKKKLTLVHQYPKSENIKEFQFNKEKKLFSNKRKLIITGKLINDPKIIYIKDFVDEDIRLFEKILEHLESEKIANKDI